MKQEASSINSPHLPDPLPEVRIPRKQRRQSFASDREDDALEFKDNRFPEERGIRKKRDERSACLRGSRILNKLQLLRGHGNALFWVHSGVRKILAQEGQIPPGYPPGARWGSLVSLALSDSTPGPIFTAKVTLLPHTVENPTAVATSNHLGLWAAAAFGNVTLLLRTGQPPPSAGARAGATIQSFTVLSTVAGSSSQTRSFNNQSKVVVSIVFTDHSAQISEMTLPASFSN